MARRDPPAAGRGLDEHELRPLWVAVANDLDFIADAQLERATAWNLVRRLRDRSLDDGDPTA